MYIISLANVNNDTMMQQSIEESDERNKRNHGHFIYGYYITYYTTWVVTEYKQDDIVPSGAPRFSDKGSAFLAIATRVARRVHYQAPAGA
jgi:hypothetical protein